MTQRLKKQKKDDSKCKKDATASKLNAEPSILPGTIDGKNVEAHSDKELSSKNKESKGSNMDVLESTVHNKNNIFHFGKYCLYLQSHIINLSYHEKKNESNACISEVEQNQKDNDDMSKSRTTVSNKNNIFHFGNYCF